MSCSMRPGLRRLAGLPTPDWRQWTLRTRCGGKRGRGSNTSGRSGFAGRRCG